MHAQLLVISLILAALAVPAQAQEYLPYSIGDRWVYEVEGTYFGEVVDAVAEWTVLDVRSSADVDTITVQVVKRPVQGDVTTTECRLRRDRQQEIIFLSALYDGQEDFSACRGRGGSPFGDGQTTSYPFLFGPYAAGQATVSIGGTSYTRDTAEGRFGDGVAPCPACGTNTSYNTIVSALLADEIGLVGSTIRETECLHTAFPCTSVRDDTIVTRLVGAEVSGEIYGTITPVATEFGAELPALALRFGPNPTRRFVRLSIVGAERDEEARVRILDAQGRVVRDQTLRIRQSTEFDLAGLAAGVYFVRADLDGMTLRDRLVVLD